MLHDFYLKIAELNQGKLSLKILAHWETWGADTIQWIEDSVEKDVIKNRELFDLKLIANQIFESMSQIDKNLVLVTLS